MSGYGTYSYRKNMTLFSLSLSDLKERCQIRPYACAKHHLAALKALLDVFIECLRKATMALALECIRLFVFPFLDPKPAESIANVLGGIGFILLSVVVDVIQLVLSPLFLAVRTLSSLLLGYQAPPSKVADYVLSEDELAKGREELSQSFAK